MKRICLFLFVSLFAVATVAQNVVLVDTEGKEYANGETLTLFAVDEKEGDEVVWAQCPSPIIYNKGSEDINSVMVAFTVKSMPKGTSFMYCWGGDCQIAYNPGTPMTSLAASLKAGQKLPSLIEWIPVNENFEFIEGVCTVDWTIYENGKPQNHYTVRYVRGEDAVCGSNLTWDLEDGILYISGNGAMENYSSKTNAPWYSSRSDISIVAISEGVTSIGNDAFSDCSNLNSIIIPNSVKSIGNYALQNCSSLTSITIPNSVATIGIGGFWGCSSLTSVSIPNSVTSIERDVFYGCSGLTSITIPNSVTSIGSGAFSGCKGLTSATVPNSVTSIGVSAFNGCRGLTSVTIGNSVTSIGSSAFNGCSGLTSITIPNSVTSIGGYAFYGCSRLASVVIGDSVTSIEDYTFHSCRSLNTITIGSSVMSIGYAAFMDCSALTSITMPRSITSINDRTFWGCTNLSSVYILATNPPTVTSELFTDVSTKTIHIYEGLADVYKKAGGWSRYNVIDDIPVICITGLILDATRYQCTVGQRFKPKVVAYEPEDATFKEVTWSSSDPSTLAIVPDTGACIGLKDGIVTITATAKDSEHTTATATVYVGNTIIEGIQEVSIPSTNCNYYNLQGQKFAAPARGVNVRNGHKVLMR